MVGNGRFDLAAYEKYLGGGLKDCKYPDSKVKEAQTNMPVVE